MLTRCCDVLSMFVLSEWQFWTLFGAPKARRWRASVHALFYLYLLCDPRRSDNYRKVRAPRRVSASEAPHVVTWTKQTWIKHHNTVDNMLAPSHSELCITIIYVYKKFLVLFIYTFLHHFTLSHFSKFAKAPLAFLHRIGGVRSRWAEIWTLELLESEAWGANHWAIRCNYVVYLYPLAIYDIINLLLENVTFPLMFSKQYFCQILYIKTTVWWKT